MSGMRRELYDDAQVRSRRDLLRIDPLRTSSPIGGLGLGLARRGEERPEQDASQALRNMTLSIQGIQAGSDTAKRRDFFLQYPHKEIGSLRYAISQDAINSVEP